MWACVRRRVCTYVCVGARVRVRACASVRALNHSSTCVPPCGVQLNGIVGLADVLLLDAQEGRRLTPRSIECIDSMKSSGLRLAALVDDILELSMSRGNAGQHRRDMRTQHLHLHAEAPPPLLAPCRPARRPARRGGSLPFCWTLPTENSPGLSLNRTHSSVTA